MNRYQISISAVDIPNKAGLFRISSPYASVKLTTNGQSIDLGETEHVNKCLSPDWAKVFICDISPEEITNIEITIWDYNEGKKRVKMGEATFEATSVYQEPGKTSSEPIGRNKKSK
jgi:Ca2+-dependent lipid-binding protein